MFILSGDLKGFTNAILFQFLMLILPPDWQTSWSPFPSWRNHPRMIELAEVKSIAKLRSEIWISWSTIAALDFITLFLEMMKDLRDNSLRIAYWLRVQVLELVGAQFEYSLLWILDKWLHLSRLTFSPSRQSPRKADRCELVCFPRCIPKR